MLNNWPHCVNDWHYGLRLPAGLYVAPVQGFSLEILLQPWELTTIIITILQKRELRRWKHTQGQLAGQSNGEAQIWIQEVSLGIVCTQSQSLHQSISLLFPKRYFGKVLTVLVHTQVVEEPCWEQWEVMVIPCHSELIFSKSSLVDYRLPMFDDFSLCICGQIVLFW